MILVANSVAAGLGSLFFLLWYAFPLVRRVSNRS
jgi:hypothetical protein